MVKYTKKSCEAKGGTWKNGRCSLKRSSVTGTRTTKEIRYLRMKKKEPTVADVSGVGIKLTKELAKTNIITCNDVQSEEQLHKVKGVGKSLSQRILTFCKKKFSREQYAKDQKRLGKRLKELGLYQEVPRDEEGNVIIEKEPKWEVHELC